MTVPVVHDPARHQFPCGFKDRIGRPTHQMVVQTLDVAQKIERGRRCVALPAKLSEVALYCFALPAAKFRFLLRKDPRSAPVAGREDRRPTRTTSPRSSISMVETTSSMNVPSPTFGPMRWARSPRRVKVGLIRDGQRPASAPRPWPNTNRHAKRRAPVRRVDALEPLRRSALGPRALDQPCS
jgi:hypothetical protein